MPRNAGRCQPFAMPPTSPVIPVPALFEIARANALHGAFVASLLALQMRIDQVFGRHLSINAARLLGAVTRRWLVGHLLEEQSQHSARAIWAAAKRDIRYTEEP